MDSYTCKEGKDYYIVGERFEEIKKGMFWKFIGIFDSYDKAKKACKTSRHFINLVNKNEVGPKVEEKNNMHSLK